MPKRTWKHPSLEYTKLVDDKFFRSYINEGYRRRLTDREDLVEIQRAIFKEISDQIAKSRGGVFIRGVGYFFVWKIPRKLYFWRNMQNEDKPWYGNVYSIKFYPSRRLRGWVFTKRWASTLSKKVYHQLLKGFKYRMYLYSLKVFNLLK